MRKHVGPHVRLERIENRASDGMPDVLSIHNGKVAFIELKAVDDWPKTDRGFVLGEEHGLRRSQRNWHLEWSKAGGKSLILIGVGRELFLIPGTYGDHINLYKKPDFDCMARFDWPGIINILKVIP
jgi:hypothetical protein